MWPYTLGGSEAADDHHVEHIAGSLGVHVAQHKLLLNVLWRR